MDNPTSAETTAEFTVIDNTEASRFELHHQGEVVSVADYRAGEGHVVVPHVGTPPEHRGQGYAGRLMDGMLEQLRASERRIVPICPFAAQHIRDNPEWHDLIQR